MICSMAPCHYWSRLGRVRIDPHHTLRDSLPNKVVQQKEGSHTKKLIIFENNDVKQGKVEKGEREAFSLLNKKNITC